MRNYFLAPCVIRLIYVEGISCLFRALAWILTHPMHFSLNVLYSEHLLAMFVWASQWVIFRATLLATFTSLSFPTPYRPTSSKSLSSGCFIAPTSHAFLFVCLLILSTVIVSNVLNPLADYDVTFRSCFSLAELVCFDGTDTLL